MKNAIYFIAIIIVVVFAGLYMFGGERAEVPEQIKEVVSVETEEKVFNLTGENYIFSVTEIRVKEGDTVTVNFTSTEGYHDWVVNEFGVGTERVTEGNSTSVTFVADKKGEFEFYCSVSDHKAKGMIGTLIVE